jgi:hypothetical protein
MASLGKPALRILSALHALALQARCAQVNLAQLAQIEGRLSDLQDDDPVRPLVQRLAQLRLAQRDAAALRDFGADLQRDVMRALRPDPAGLGRVDIHG